MTAPDPKEDEQVARRLVQWAEAIYATGTIVESHVRQRHDDLLYAAMRIEAHLNASAPHPVAGGEERYTLAEIDDVVEELLAGWTDPSGPADEAHRRGYGRAVYDIRHRLRWLRASGSTSERPHRVRGRERRKEIDPRRVGRYDTRRSPDRRQSQEERT